MSFPKKKKNPTRQKENMEQNFHPNVIHRHKKKKKKGLKYRLNRINQQVDLEK